MHMGMYYVEYLCSACTEEEFTENQEVVVLSDVRVAPPECALPRGGCRLVRPNKVRLDDDDDKQQPYNDDGHRIIITTS